MDTSTVFVIGFILIVVAALITAGQESEKRKAKYAAAQNKAADFVKDIIESGGLTPIPSPSRLEEGEVCYYSEHACLLEARPVSEYNSSSVGVKMTRNISVRSTKGKSVSHDRIQIVDNGTLSVTNRRIIFMGTRGQRSFALSSIMANSRIGHVVEITSSERENKMLFAIENGRIFSFVLKVCLKFEIPSEFSVPKKFFEETNENEFDSLIADGGDRRKFALHYSSSTGASIAEAFIIADKAIGSK